MSCRLLAPTVGVRTCSMEKEMFRFVVLPCFDLGLTVLM